MSWKSRNQNNIIPFKKGVENKQKIEAEDRIKMIVGSIDVKMQQPYWDALALMTKSCSCFQILAKR